MATYKGIGFDTATARTRTGTSSDDISFDAQITATDSISVSAGGISVTGGTSTDTLTTTGDASVGGDLTVAGDIISRGTVDLVVQDNFIDLNAGNTSTTALSSGFTFSLNRNSSFTTSTVTTFVAGIASTSNPTFTATDAGSSSLLAAGDVVFITGAAEGSNDGLYVVSSVNQASFPQVVTIKGVGTVATNANTPWAQTQFTADTGDTASAYKVDLKVIAIADGTNFPDSGGTANTKGTTLEIYVANATESDFTGNGDYTELGAASSLQTAYNTGATITTASSTDIAFTLSSGNFSVQNGSMDFGGTTALSTFNVDTSGAITFDSSGGGLSLDGAGASNFTTSSGALTLDGNGGVNIAGNAAEIDVTTTGALDLNSGAFTLDASTASIDSTDTSNFTMTANDAGAKVFTISAANSGSGDGSLTMTAKTAVNINATGTASTVIGNAGSNDVTIDSAGGFSVDVADTTNITMAANDGSNKTLTIAASNSGGGNGLLDVDADGAITIDAGGALSLDAGAASNLTTSAGALTLDGAAGVNIAGNAAEIDVTTTGAVDVNGGSATITATGTTGQDVQLEASGTDGGIYLNASGAGVDGAIFFESAGEIQTFIADNRTSANGYSLQIAVGTSGSSVTVDRVDTTNAAFSAAEYQKVAATELMRQDFVVNSTDLGTSGNAANIGCIFGVNTGVTPAIGDIMAIGANGLIKAQADSVANAKVVGVALSLKNAGQSAGTHDIRLMNTVGHVVLMKITSGTPAAGNVVYLSDATAGEATLTPPSGSDDIVFELGYVASATAVNTNFYACFFFPRFVMEIG